MLFSNLFHVDYDYYEKKISPVLNPALVPKRLSTRLQATFAITLIKNRKFWQFSIQKNFTSFWPHYKKSGAVQELFSLIVSINDVIGGNRYIYCRVPKCVRANIVFLLHINDTCDFKMNGNYVCWWYLYYLFWSNSEIGLSKFRKWIEKSCGYFKFKNTNAEYWKNIFYDFLY